jgi:hypothetical protein
MTIIIITPPAADTSEAPDVQIPEDMNKTEQAANNLELEDDST